MFCLTEQNLMSMYFISDLSQFDFRDETMNAHPY
jgi:hypothetical protein